MYNQNSLMNGSSSAEASNVFIDAETYRIPNIRRKQAKQFNLQELPYVSSIEFPLRFNKKYTDNENIEKLIHKCGGNTAVSSYIDDLEEDQKIQEFKLLKKKMLLERRQNRKANKHNKPLNLAANDNDEIENNTDDEEEVEEEEEGDLDIDENESGDELISEKRKKRKKKDPLTKDQMQPTIGDDALYMYLCKSQDASTDFFNEKPILGRPTRDQKILLKVKLSKSDIPNWSNMSLIEKLQHSGVHYETEPIAIIDSSIVFRVTSDAQFTLKNNNFAEEYKKAVLDLNFSEIDKFISSIQEMDTKAFLPLNEKENAYDLIPPVKSFISEMPFEYEYKSNKLAKKINNSNSLYVPTYQVQVSSFNEITPMEPSKDLMEKWELAQTRKRYPHFLESDTAQLFYKDLQEMIALLKEKFEKRPIWLKKHLQGVVVDKTSMCGSVLKYALPFVAYRIMKGPWIHSYCRYGIDPKSDPKYAIYQVEQFRIASPAPTHIFKDFIPCPKTYTSNNGDDIDTRFYLTGSSIPWYSTYTVEVLMKEPHVSNLLNDSKYLEKCDAETGWFNELDTWKRKRIVKYILDTLYLGSTDLSEDKIKIYRNMPSTKMFSNESQFTAKHKDLMTKKLKDNISEDEMTDISDSESSDYDEKLVGNINLEEASLEDIVNRITLQNQELSSKIKDEYLSYIRL